MEPQRYAIGHTTGAELTLASPAGGHAPAVLVNVTSPDGEALVKGRQVTGFSNSEEAAVGLTEVVPFLLEDRLQALGGIYSSGEDWHPHTVVDGLHITGQNPGSSEVTADHLLAALNATWRLCQGMLTAQRRGPTVGRS